MLAKTEGQGEAPGAVRTATTRDGRKQVEKLQDINPHKHFYRYKILSTPLPVRDYKGDFRVTDNHNGSCTLLWTNEFDVDAREEASAVAMVQGFLEAGVDALKRKYSFASSEHL